MNATRWVLVWLGLGNFEGGGGGGRTHTTADGVLLSTVLVVDNHTSPVRPIKQREWFPSHVSFHLEVRLRVGLFGSRDGKIQLSFHFHFRHSVATIASKFSKREGNKMMKRQIERAVFLCDQYVNKNHYYLSLYIYIKKLRLWVCPM